MTLENVDGGWSDWSAWNSCNKTCESGFQEVSETAHNQHLKVAANIARKKGS